MNLWLPSYDFTWKTTALAQMMVLLLVLLPRPTLPTLLLDTLPFKSTRLLSAQPRPPTNWLKPRCTIFTHNPTCTLSIPERERPLLVLWPRSLQW